MGTDQRGSAFAAEPGVEEGFKKAEDLLRERDLARGIHRDVGSAICIEFVLNSYNAEIGNSASNSVPSSTVKWPLDPNLDEVRGSIEIACKHANLSMDKMRVMKNQRRHSFTVFLPNETCEALVDAITMDIYYGPDRSQEQDVEYHTYSTDERGNKIDSTRDTGREAQLESERLRRKELMIILHYSLPKDLLGAKADSPIFDKIKAEILSRIEHVFGDDPNTKPQHVNLIEAKTEEGASAHGYTGFIVLNDDYYDKPASVLHNLDLSLLKYIPSGNGSLVYARMPNRALELWENKQCCFRHDSMQIGDDTPRYECPSEGGTCQLRKQTLEAMMAELRASSTHSPMEPEHESLGAKRKRLKIEGQQLKQHAAAAHRATIQPKTCRNWEEGNCRRIESIGFQKCTKAHPDEANQTRKIECCSSAARPEPTKCRFARGTCPYNGHRETI